MHQRVSMHDLISFLNQGWVGTAIGILGLVLAIFFYVRSRISGTIAYQSQDVSIVGGDDSSIPTEVEVLYRTTPIPKLTSSTVWIWNAGKKLLKDRTL